MNKLLGLVMIILFIQYPTQSQSQTQGLIGYQNFYIEDSLSETLKKIKGYKIDNPLKQLISQKHSFNPYLILTQRFLPFFYTSNALKVKIKKNVYYFSFEGLKIDHPEYMAYFDKPHFLLQYHRLRTLNIHHLRNLQQLGSHLYHFSFQFYRSVLYQMDYQKKVNMDQLNRIISGFNGRYKRIRQSKGKTQDSKYKVISWRRGKIRIQLTLDLKTYENLNKVDSIRTNPEDFKDQLIHVSIKDDKILQKIHDYKSQVYENLMDTLKQMSEDRQRKLKSITQQNK